MKYCRRSISSLLWTFFLVIRPSDLLASASSPLRRSSNPSKQNGDSSNKPDQDRGWGRWRLQRTNSTGTSDTSTTNKETASKENDRPKAPERKTSPIRNPFNRAKGEAPKTTTPEAEKKPQKNVDEQQKEELVPAHNTTSPPTSTNETTSSAGSELSRANYLILGTAPLMSPNRQYGRQPPAPQRGSPAPNAPQSSLLVVELLNAMVALGARLWFIPLLTRWIALQEESVYPRQHFLWERLNDRYLRDGAALRRIIRTPPTGVAFGRWRRKHVFREGKRRGIDVSSLFSRTAVVVEVKSDSKGEMDLEHFSDVVSFLLQQHRSHAFGTRKETGDPVELEVVLLVQSPGGSVATYGLAAAQVQRLSREEGITTTVCVDKYAASGGYMIASQAEKLIAAPFATIGSVGVIMEGFNFNELAKKYGIKPFVIKAGAAKNPLSMFGPISSKDVASEQGRLEKVHEVFKEMVVDARPALKPFVDKVTDGSVFLGQEALALQLVDSVMTSDEYIFERIQSGYRVLKLHRSNPARFSRMLNLSPLDVLPYLRSVISDKVTSSDGDISVFVSRLLRAGGFISCAQYAINLLIKGASE
jgi:signal peptide peptidase SppA